LLARNADISILVLDSSREETVTANATALAAMGARIRHRIFPSTVPVAEKLATGLKDVTTPYVSLCADDDLIFPSALVEAINFLEGHPDYVSAHGLYVNFQNHGNEVYITREYAGPSNAVAQSGLRVFRLMQNYESLFYGLFRTSELQKIMDGVAALPSLHYQELYQSVAALLIGKVHRFPKIYAGRRSCEAAEPERDKWQTYYWFADNPTEVLAHYQIYREALWTFYQTIESNGLGRDDLLKAVDVAHAVYFSRGCPPRYFHDSLRPRLWPNEEFEDVTTSDLFRRLRAPDSGTRAKSRLARLWFTLRRRHRARARARRANDLDALNARIKAEGETPWSCRLPVGLLWLADVEDFQEKYRDLCLYLDSVAQTSNN